jgi:hypothetical protein
VTGHPPRRSASRARARFLVSLAGLAAFSFGGCSTQRTLTIDSEPSGARVWVNGRLRGTTPVDVPFVHPGTWSVRLEKKGYASVAQDVGVRSTMADAPLFDLPGELTVRNRRWHFVHKLTPLPARPTESDLAEALQRAQDFRVRAHKEVAEGGTPGSGRPASAPSASPAPASAPPANPPPGTTPPRGGPAGGAK